MGRTRRLLLNGVCYHVINRGNQQQRVFLDEEDCEKFLQLLKRYKRRYHMRLYAYCLMPNHIHLVLEMADQKLLPKLMQGVTQTYAIWFNAKYRKVGHLWQGRYKNFVIEKDEYLFDCMQYVELNPVRAQLVAHPSEYPWSSYAARVLGTQNGLVDTLDLVGGHPSLDSQRRP